MTDKPLFRFISVLQSAMSEFQRILEQLKAAKAAGSADATAGLKTKKPMNAQAAELQGIMAQMREQGQGQGVAGVQEKESPLLWVGVFATFATMAGLFVFLKHRQAKAEANKPAA